MKTLMVILLIIHNSGNVESVLNTQIVDDKQCLHAETYILAHQELNIRIECVPMFTQTEVK